MRPSRHVQYPFLFWMMLMTALLFPETGGTEETPPMTGHRSPVVPHTAVDTSEATPAWTVAGQPTQPAARKSVKSEARQEPQQPSAEAPPPPDPNRRWIMKQKDYRKQGIKPKTFKPLKWKTPSQKSACQSRKRHLALDFEKAQFYSVQGDRCKTAQYAQSFLETARQCELGCPDSFLEYNGFGEQVVRNMRQLKALGLESCLGPSPKTGSPYEPARKQ